MSKLVRDTGQQRLVPNFDSKQPSEPIKVGGNLLNFLK